MTALIQAILFDLGGTLKRSRKHTDAERQHGLIALNDLLSVQWTPEEWDRKLQLRAREYKRWAEESLKELTEEDFWAKWMLPDLPEALVRPLALDLHRIWRRAVATPQLIPQADVVLRKLFRRGYRLGLISNTSGRTSTPETLAELGIKDYFETVILSTTHGRRKPDPHPFELATRALETRPESCAFVGNRQDTDLAGARRAGFGTVVLLRRPDTGKRTAGDASLAPDHWIDNLEELLTIFPPRFSPRAPGLRRATQTSRPRWQASISTMWGSPGFPDLGRFLRSATEMGFSGIELNHEVNSAMLAGTDLQPYAITSVHEPCPADVATGRMAALDWQLSSEDEDKRKQALRMVKRSIHLAREVGAGLVVVHPGSVRGDGGFEKRLRALFNAGEIDTELALSLRDELVEHRSHLAAPRLDAALRSLAELLVCAREEGILLGLENRYHYLDIPTPDEMGLLLDCGSERELGVVYDVGHGQAMDRLGFYPQDTWLERFADRIVEVHLHDVKGIDDHLAAGLGEVDFGRIAPRLPPGALRACELRPSNSPRQVIDGMQILVQHGCVEALEPGR